MTISTQVRAQAGALTADLPPQRSPHPSETGFRVAALEIAQGMASFTNAQQRGLFPDDQGARFEWDQGYADCICAYRLGHHVSRMVRAEIFMPSPIPASSVIAALLDGEWQLEIRMDPRTP